ncbi:MAG: carbohydrate ABC transporter permease [Clostridiales bacterium]|nr:carbohydrate ABC transporter permease [Clostridiales bacterium]
MAEQAKTLTFNKKNVVKESGSDRVFSFIVHAFLIVIMLVMIYPLYFVVIASISDPFDVVNGRVFLWPVNFSLDSYAHVMGTNSIWVGYKNTIINTVIYVAYSLCITIPAAYVVAKRNLPGRRLLNLFFLITMFFGGGMVPTYLMYKEFGMLNTRWSLILTSTSCYNMIVARTYFSTSIPESLYEAAEIDGANEFTCFFRIALPLAGSIIAVIALFVASGVWNSYYNALLYIRDQSLYPLQLVLRDILINAANAFQNIEAGSADADVYEQALRLTYLAESMKYSIIFIASFPMLALYPFVQKYFVKGVMIGAVKG